MLTCIDRARFYWVRRYGLASLLVLVTIELTSWYWFGRASALKRLPAMIRFDLAYLELPRGETSPYVAVMSEESPPLDPGVMRAVQAAFGEFGLLAHPLGDMVAGTRLTLNDCPDRALTESPRCLLLRYENETLPLYSEVITVYARAIGDGFVFAHRQIWVLGIWVPIMDGFYGQA